MGNGSDTATTAAWPAGCPESDLDPFSIEFLEDPHPAHEVLRELGPVVRLRRWDCYAVARYEQVHAVLNDPATFCSGRGVGLSDFAKEEPWRPASLVLEADPPAHTRTRAALNRVLAPSVLKTIRQHFEAAAAARVDALLAQGSFDAVPELCEAYPMAVFPDALGLRQEGREHLLPYASVVFNAYGPANALRVEGLARAAPHQAYVEEQCQRENLAPGGIGARLYAEADAGAITHAEAALLVRSLLSAGLDTTVQGIGAAVYCLARFPEEFRKLRDNPALARNAFDEAVRLESPVQLFFRTTTRTAELGGTALGEGEKVLMFFAAANRDPRRWQDPDRFDVARRTGGHVGFGSGIHICVGALFARLEGEAMLVALARKVGTIAITGPVKRLHNNSMRGLVSLPVTITPA